MDADELADVHWLLGAEAARHLADLAERPGDLLRRASRLRQSLTAARTRLICEQADLRRRARKKFALADRMFFSRKAYEQATDEQVAAYKAGRFAGGGSIVDFCCGIGGDLLSLSQIATCLGVERDPIVAALAAANLDAARGAGRADLESRVACRALTLDDAKACDAWHLDPDRRPAGRRTTRAELHEPAPNVIDSLRGVQPRGAVKLAPAAQWPDHWPPEAELEWISRDGECRQLVVWFAPLSSAAGKRRATAIRDNTATFLGAPNESASRAEGPLPFVYELDSSLLASGLAGSFMSELELAAVSPDGGYATADTLQSHGLLTAFEVLEAMPFKLSRLKDWLAARRIGRIEIKHRGLDFDPRQLMQALKGAGDAEATILLTGRPGNAIAIVARRIRARAAN